MVATTRSGWVVLVKEKVEVVLSLWGEYTHRHVPGGCQVLKRGKPLPRCRRGGYLVPSVSRTVRRRDVLHSLFEMVRWYVNGVC